MKSSTACQQGKGKYVGKHIRQSDVAICHNNGSIVIAVLFITFMLAVLGLVASIIVSNFDTIVEMHQPRSYINFNVVRTKTAELEPHVDEYQATVTSESITESIGTINSIVSEIDIPTDQEIINDEIGNQTIELSEATLQKYDLPDTYYDGLDYSTFQPYMSYHAITNPDTPAYEVVNSENAYTDGNGFRRYVTDDSCQFTINGNDDYVIALGTFYKEKGTCGDRWLIVTSTGAYTATTGDEKSDNHTDDLHMFSDHGEYAGLIEWLVDTDTLDTDIKLAGTVTAGPVEAIQGEIKYIYRIE